jgi:hypothetical protein
MNDTPKQSLAVLRQVAEFLEGLPADQVDDLAEGRARLTIIPWGSSEPLTLPRTSTRKATQPATTTVDVAAIAAQVEAAASRDLAQALLSPLKVADLKAIATELHIAAAPATKPALIKRIVELTVGARLSGDALRAL